MRAAPIIDKVSYSTWKLWTSGCRKQFKYSKVDKLEGKKIAKAEAVLIPGRIIHEAIQLLFETYIWDNNFIPKKELLQVVKEEWPDAFVYNSFEEDINNLANYCELKNIKKVTSLLSYQDLKSRYLDFLLGLVAARLDDEVIESNIYLDGTKIYQKVQKALKLFIDNFFGLNGFLKGFKYAKSEIPIQVMVGDLNVTGTLDLLSMFSENDYALLDFKSSTKGDENQLYFYLFILALSLGQVRCRSGWYLLNSGKFTWLKWTKSNLDHIYDSLRRMSSELKVIDPEKIDGEPSRECFWCSYTDICDEYKEYSYHQQNKYLENDDSELLF